MTWLSAPDALDRERRVVDDDLSLAMLFLDVGEVSTEVAGDVRTLRVLLELSSPASPARAALLLCRLLLNERVVRIALERRPRGALLRAKYLLAGAEWRVEVEARSPRLHGH